MRSTTAPAPHLDGSARVTVKATSVICGQEARGVRSRGDGPGCCAEARGANHTERQADLV